MLRPVDDVAKIGVPANCAIEQLTYYVDDDLLVVQGEIWGALSNTQKASLILHEAIYRYERYEGAINSRRTRKIVASLFSGLQFESTKANLRNDAKVCAAHRDGKTTYQFYYYSTQSDMTKLQFTLFKGSSVFSRKTSVIPISLPWWEYYHNNTNCGAAKLCNSAGGETQSNFGGNDFITIGRQWDLDGNYLVWFYILDDRGLNYLDCRM